MTHATYIAQLSTKAQHFIDTAPTFTAGEWGTYKADQVGKAARMLEAQILYALTATHAGSPDDAHLSTLGSQLAEIARDLGC